MPQFTQLDMEMAFMDEDAIMGLSECLVAAVFKEAAGVEVQTPLRRLTYAEAMESYCSDKPDLRYGLTCCTITDTMASCGFR